MWLTSSAVFWSSAGALAYTYAGYPALVWTLSRLRPRAVRAAPVEPSVTLVLAARDEAKRIAAKLDNLLSLDYPRGLLTIVVASASADGTDAIVERYAGRGVRLVRVPRDAGKAVQLNAGVRAATGEVVVFCDARQRVDRAALRAVVAPLADPNVGAVSGELVLDADRGPGLYWRYEKAIRHAESRLDSVVGATGAFFAIRRALFRELPAGLILDDVFTPLQIALAGYRVLFEPAAKVFDEEADPATEFHRKARTLAGNFQLLEALPALLSPRRNRLLPQLVSHKLLRLAGPYLLAALLGSNVALVLTLAPGWPLYVVTLTGQLALYGLALRGALAGESAGRLARVAHTFVTLNLAAAEGLRRYLARDFSWS